MVEGKDTVMTIVLKYTFYFVELYYLLYSHTTPHLMKYNSNITILILFHLWSYR